MWVDFVVLGKEGVGLWSVCPTNCFIFISFLVSLKREAEGSVCEERCWLSSCFGLFGLGAFDGKGTD